MAYVSKETTKAIRDALKAEFGKTVKFGVRKSSSSIALTVTVKESPFFDDGEQHQVNHHWIDEHYQGDQAAFLTKVNDIIKTAGDWWDKSDVMTDYFHTAFYYHIEIGSWDKPHKKI